MPKFGNIKRALSSKDEFVRSIQTREWPEEGKAQFNEDLLPTPLGKMHVRIICYKSMLTSQNTGRGMPSISSHTTSRRHFHLALTTWVPRL